MRTPYICTFNRKNTRNKTISERFYLLNERMKKQIVAFRSCGCLEKEKNK